MISDICELFGCTPDVAERQDPNMVNRIAEYRAAGRAIGLMNQGGSQGVQALSQEPALMALLREMMQTQHETLVTDESIMGEMLSREDEDQSDG